MVEPSLPGAAGGTARSAGVMLLARHHLSCELIALPRGGTGGSGRWLLAKLGLKRFVVAIAVVYLETAIGLVGPNLAILDDLGAAVLGHGLLTVALGDWNSTPKELDAVGWPAALGLAHLPGGAALPVHDSAPAGPRLHRC